MSNEISLLTGNSVLGPLVEQARAYIESSLADNTKRAYKADWKHFTEWCRGHGLEALPAAPETVVLFVSQLADTHKVSSISRKLASISVAHQAAGHESPTHSSIVRRTLQGIEREHGSRKVKKKALTAAVLRRVVDRLPEGLIGVRDRALLLLGYCGGFRRSELTALDLAHIDFNARGLLVRVNRSKTDQAGEGLIKGIGYGLFADTCPVRSLKAWIEAAEISQGPLFRAVTRSGRVQEGRLSDRAVALVVKRRAATVGVDEAEVAGHSLRSGFVTDQHEAGTPQARIMAQTGHRSAAQLLDYFQVHDLLGENLTQRVGL